MKAANILENTRTGPLMDGYQTGRHSYCNITVMIRSITIVALVLVPFLSFSQFGINARYLTSNTAGIVSQNGFLAGIEYHFRLKSNRVEFHPLFGYRRSFEAGYGSHLTSFDFDFNTAIYPFDFEGDCNCPTFSKQGTLFKKGFFLEFQPGIGYQTIYITHLENEHSSNVVFKLGGAAGLDIGLSDQYTLTPFISGTTFISGEWEVLKENLPSGGGKLDDFIVFGAGIRLSYSSEDSQRGHRY